jgi:hypothetical protein
LRSARRRSKEGARVVEAADGLEAAHHPETAGEEGAFAGGKTVLHFGCVVAQDKTIWAARHEFALDGFDGAPDTRIGTGQEADQWHEEEAGVELLGAVGLHEAVFLPAEGAGTDVLVDRVARGLPLLDGTGVVELRARSTARSKVSQSPINP